MINQNELLILDRSGTLTDHWTDALFPNITEFVLEQTKLRLYAVATLDRAKDQNSLALLQSLQYFGRNRIGANKPQYYINHNGEIKIIEDDYEEDPYFQKITKSILRRIAKLKKQQEKSTDRNLKLKLQKEIDNLSDNYDVLKTKLRHKNTHTPFDENSKYMNPNDNRYALPKDIYLLKKLLYGAKSKGVKSVMIGNFDDIPFITSDPSTPLIVIADKLWATRNRIKILLEHLFNDSDFPATIFDDLYVNGTSINEANIFNDYFDLTSKPPKRINICNETFLIGYGAYGQRLIIEDPNMNQRQNGLKK